MNLTRYTPFATFMEYNIDGLTEFFAVAPLEDPLIEMFSFQIGWIASGATAKKLSQTFQYCSLSKNISAK